MCAHVHTRTFGCVCVWNNQCLSYRICRTVSSFCGGNLTTGRWSGNAVLGWFILFQSFRPFELVEYRICFPALIAVIRFYSYCQNPKFGTRFVLGHVESTSPFGFLYTPHLIFFCGSSRRIKSIYATGGLSFGSQLYMELVRYAVKLYLIKIILSNQFYFL